MKRHVPQALVDRLLADPAVRSHLRTMVGRQKSQVETTRLRELGRRVEGNPEVLRRVNRLAGEPIVDKAIEEGRAAEAEREHLLRFYEVAPDDTRKLLEARQPDPVQAAANGEAWTEEDEAAFRRDFAAQFGGRPEDVA